MAGFGQQALLSGIQATGQVGTNLGTYGFTARKNWKYRQKEMALQQNYNRQAFDWENERQDYLFRNQLSMMKEGMKNAGYSTANPDNLPMTGSSTNNVEGVSPGSNIMDSPPGVGFNMSYQDFIQGMVAEEQAKNIESQTRLNNIEADYKANYMQSEIDQRNATAQAIRDKLPKEIQKLEKEIDVLEEQKDLTHEQANVQREQVKQLEALVRGIDIDNEWKPKRYRSEISLNSAQAYQAWQNGEYQRIVNGLADEGIYVNGSLLGQLGSFAHEHGFDEGFLHGLEEITGVNVPGSAANRVKDVLSRYIVEPLFRFGRNVNHYMPKHPETSLDEKKKSWVDNPNK